MKVNQGNTLLNRGFELVQFILCSGQPLRYKHIKEAFPLIGDASLSRILKTLIESEYVLQNSKKHYLIGKKLISWKFLLNEKLDSAERLIAETTSEIAQATNCSAAFIRFETDHLVFRHTKNLPENWSLSEDGSALHFEDDHAAALAWMDNTDDNFVTSILCGSKFNTLNEITKPVEAINNSKNDGYYTDKSRKRLGLSRCAVWFSKGSIEGVFIIGLSSEELRQKERQLSEILKDCCLQLEMKLKKKGDL
ncbi:MAG: hypothetical protein ACRC37_01705 [Lentisphaeria bacterium]